MTGSHVLLLIFEVVYKAHTDNDSLFARRYNRLLFVL